MKNSLALLFGAHLLMASATFGTDPGSLLRRHATSGDASASDVKAVADAAAESARFDALAAEEKKASRDAITVYSTDRIVPLIVTGEAGSSSIVTRIDVVNTGTRTTEMLIEFFDGFGDRVALPLLNESLDLVGPTNAAGTSMGVKTVAKVYVIPQDSRTRMAYARIRTTPSGSAEVFVTHMALSDDTSVTALSTGRRNDSREYYFLVNPSRTPGWSLSLTNVSSLSLTATISARSMSGRLLCQGIATVASGGMLNSRVPQTDTCFSSLQSEFLLEVIGSRDGLQATTYSFGANSMEILPPVIRQ